MTTPRTASTSDARKRLAENAAAPEPTDQGGGYAEVVERVLRENGLTDEPAKYGSDIHSWRCEHPDVYGPCRCFSDLASDLAIAVADAHARAIAATQAEAWDEGWKAAVRGVYTAPGNNANPYRPVIA